MRKGDGTCLANDAQTTSVLVPSVDAAADQPEDGMAIGGAIHLKTKPKRTAKQRRAKVFEGGVQRQIQRRQVVRRAPRHDFQHRKRQAQDEHVLRCRRRQHRVDQQQERAQDGGVHGDGGVRQAIDVVERGRAAIRAQRARPGREGGDAAVVIRMTGVDVENGADNGADAGAGRRTRLAATDTRDDDNTRRDLVRRSDDGPALEETFHETRRSVASTTGDATSGGVSSVSDSARTSPCYSPRPVSRCSGGPVPSALPGSARTSCRGSGKAGSGRTTGAGQEPDGAYTALETRSISITTCYFGAADGSRQVTIWPFINRNSDGLGGRVGRRRRTGRSGH